MMVSRITPPRLTLLASALSVATLMLSALGCAQPGPTQTLAAQSPPLPTLPSAPASTAAVAPPASAASADDDQTAREPIIIKGTDVTVKRQPSAQAHVARGEVGGLKFDNAPVGDVVQVMLRDLLKVDYVIHPPLQGTVTLVTRGPISADRALLLLETALQANGIVMARDSRGVYHVGTPDALQGIVAAPSIAEPGEPLPPGYGAVIIPLRYLGANEMANILRPMVSPDAILRVDTVRNLLVMRGTRAEAEGWLDLVATFDVDLLKGMSVGVFPLKYTSIDDVTMALRLLSGATPEASDQNAPGAANTPAQPGNRRGAPQRGTTPVPARVTQAAQQAARAAALGPDSPLFGAVRIMPIERINAIMVVTPRAEYLDEVRYWIEKFDRPDMNSNQPQLYVYKVKNGSADHLAALLNGIYGNGVLTQQTGGGNGVVPNMGAVSGTNGNFNNNSSFGNRNFSSSGFGNSGFNSGSGFNGFSGGMGSGMGGIGGGMGGMGGSMGGIGGGNFNSNNNNQGPDVTTTMLGDTVRVMADRINNTLLIHATPKEYERIESSLKRLDVQRAQVLIEASIVEVTLNNDMQYGLEWAFNSKVNTIGLAPSSSTNGDSSPTGGFTWAYSNSTRGINATLSALADKSLIKVISSPSLLVLDNQTAAIQVGNQEPTSSGSVTNTSSDYTSAAIQYVNTGVMLGVTPSITAGDLVTMDINQVVSNIGADRNVAGANYPTFSQRQINTEVAVRSGQTIVLGGLIQDSAQADTSGLPFLSNLPLVGALFGTHSNNKQRTELLVVITPRVLRSDEDARAVSREMRDRMRGLTAGDLPKPVMPAMP